jgi:putative DNA primase/helicase
MITDDDNISFDKINQWADFWYYKIGINIFPLDNDKATYENWSRYQTESIPDETHEEWKRTGRYSQGIVLMPGTVWRGDHKGLYFVGIDFDKELGINEFCNIIDGTNIITIEELKQRFIVEQHKGDPNSFHVYFYSEIPFTDKSPDNVLGIEIKSNGKGLMCATPSYHSETKSRWQIKGTDSPVILTSEEATRLMSEIAEICRKYNIPYIKNGNDASSSSPLTLLIRQMIVSLEINPYIIIHEGERHAILLAIANSLLIKNKYNKDVNTEQLKNFFSDINNKLCVPEPLPESEIERIWKDAIKFSEEKTAGIQLVSKDENDIQNYNSPIVVQLEKTDKLIERDFVQNLVYDIQTNSIDCTLNSKYKPEVRIIVPINIKQWPDVRKNFKKECIEKGVKEEDISPLLESVDINVDLIKKYYLENHKRHVAALAAAEERKKQRLELIGEGTDFIMAKYRFLTIEESNEILFYDSSKGVYTSGGHIIIDKEIDKKFGYKLKTADITEIKNYVRRKTYAKLEEFDPDIDIINLKNGLFNWRTNEFFPHTPDYYSLNQKPIKYNPEAIPRRFIKFLREVLHLRDIRTVVELMAYTFIRTHLFQKYFILIGGGGNGKNVLIGILTHLHGKKNVSNVPLKSIAKERFALVDLVNKDINVDTESTSINDISTLKKLTDNQSVRVEQKGQPAFDARLYAKPIFAANELPTSSDDTDARFRREILIDFPNQFEEGINADLNLLNKIVNNEEEMSGIFNLIVKSMRTIVNKNKIHVNAATISARRAKAKLIQAPIKAFLEDALAKEPTSDDYETSEDMCAAFERFCGFHEISGPRSDKFLEDLKEKYKIDKGRKKLKDDKKRTVWYCKLVKWKNPDDPTQSILDDDNEEDDEEQQEQESPEEKYKREQEEMKKW